MNKNAWWILACFMSVGLGTMNRVEAEGVARIADSGEYLELTHQAEGRTTVDHLPLYRSHEVRYFSAGVGLEERLAEYPPFSLKIVFTAGGKPFLAGVSVIIQPAGGGPALTIPREQVEGPWLFVDLPAGIYDITAIYGDRAQELKRIHVKRDKPKTVHLRWAEDRGLAVNLSE
jgi:hypothetical protein